MPSKQNIQKISEWKQVNTDRIVFYSRKDKHIPERIQSAIDAGITRSRQAYILEAIETALKRDGIPLVNSGDKPE